MTAHVISLRAATEPAPAISPTLWAASEVAVGLAHLVLSARFEEPQVQRRLELAHIGDELADIGDRLGDLACGER